MKMIMMALAVFIATNSACADEAKVVSADIDEISYVSDVHSVKDGGIALDTKTEWDGVRTVKNGSVCHEETQKIVRTETRKKLGSEYQVPVVERSRKEVQCPT